LHWADKQKPLEEVAGTFSVFPETLRSPPLAPETIDEETPTEVPPEEVSAAKADIAARIPFSERFPLLRSIAMYRHRTRARDFAA